MGHVLIVTAMRDGVGESTAAGTSAPGDRPFCLSDELLRQSLQNNPALRTKIEEQERAIRAYLDGQAAKRVRLQRATSSNYIIPVVVYIIHSGVLVGTAENITDQQVNSQITALNNAFASHGVQFCLATADGSTPFPGPTPGIIRILSSLTDHLTSQESALKALSSLPGDRYLRIWVVKDIDNNSGVVGYARLPGSVPIALDGIVMRYDVFGDVANCGCSNLLPNYDQGKILAHEAGHYLDLYHTFEGGCTGVLASDCAAMGDRVCDTPQIAAADSGCPIAVASCDGTPALLDNEMDYTNDVCRNAFTAGQETRMLAAIGTLRAFLVSPQNLVFTSVQCAIGLNASFSASDYNACTQQNVTFLALTNPGTPTYAWDFGDGGTAAGLSPQHAYSSGGPYNVTLTATSGAVSVSSTQQVFVTACAPISSMQGNWYFGFFGELHFGTGVPVPGNAALTNTTIHANEACITQSDSSGNLLFYSDGRRVWNNLHQLAISGLNGGNDLTQALAVPDPADPLPANPSSFYLISMPGFPTDGNFGFTRVAVSGSALTFTAVNTPIAPPAGADNTISEMVTAVPACGPNYWIIVHGSYLDTSLAFRHALFVYPLTAAGIGTPTAYPISGPARFGQLKASPDGARIAYGTGDTRSADETGGGYAYVLDFDRNTGVLSKPRVINRYVYGVSFSPSSQLLYLTDSVTGPTEKIFQYDLSATDLNAAERLVADVPALYSALQLGPDSKIYVALLDSNHLAVINFPDQRNTVAAPNACGYSYSGPFLDIPASGIAVESGFGLPNMLDAQRAPFVSPDFHYTVSSCSTVGFSAPACATSYSWTFGDSTTSNLQNPTHTYAANGTYPVTLTLNGTTTVSHTVAIGIPPSSATIFGPSGVCLDSGNPPFYNYSANAQPGLTYSWAVTGGAISGISNGDNVNVVWNTLPVPGAVQLTLTDPVTGCSTSKSLTVSRNCNPNRCLAPPASLTNWWRFDETGGSTANDSAGFVANSGTRIGGPTAVAGVVDSALSFDGVNDYVRVPNQQEINFVGGCILDVAEPLTIDLWVKTNLPPQQLGLNSGLRTILDNRVALPSPNGYHLFLFNGRLGFQMDGANYVAPASGPNYVDTADNQWHFVAVSLSMCRGGGGFLDVDGKNVLTLPPVGGFVNSANLNIGRRDPTFGPNFFTGAMDELEMFKSRLAEDELRTIYEARSRGKCKVNCKAKNVAISPNALPQTTWPVNVTYPTVNLTASGGNAPYVFAVTGGNFSPGMTLGSDGTLSGTPSQTGLFSFTVTVVDADGCRAGQLYKLRVSRR